MSNTIKGSNIPFFNLSKETLKLIIDLLEGDDIEVFLTALYDYIYEGIEPNFNTKILKSVWNNVLSVIERKAQSYFNKAEANKDNGKKGGRPKKVNQDIPSNTEFETETPKISENKALNPQSDIIPQLDDESVSNGQEMGKYGILEIPFVVINEMGCYANDDTISKDERFINIARLLKPYSKSIPINEMPKYVSAIYHQCRRAG